MTTHQKKPHGLSSVKLFGWIGAFGAIITFLFVQLPGPGVKGSRMFGIFIAAILLWATEAVPLTMATALVIFLEVLFISDHAISQVAEDAPEYISFFGAPANPTIILFPGGSMAADGAAEYKVDRALSAALLCPLLGKPRPTVMGIMLITAAMSMFMPDMATTATMFAVMVPVITDLLEGWTRTGIALSIPVAANVGGMGALAGTPPNVTAPGALRGAGISAIFLDWMLAVIPLMLITLAISWGFIVWRYIPKDAAFSIDTSVKFDTSRNAKIFYATALATILLWMTKAFHGALANIVGFLPVVVLMLTKVMSGDDLHAFDWSVLWFVAGGIALSSGVGSTGLDKWLLGLIQWGAIPTIILLLVLALIDRVTSNVISHPTSANLLVPADMGLAATISTLAAEIAIVLALGYSPDMCLPISTPLNAIAYSMGTTPIREMAIVGVIVGIIGVLLLPFVAPLTRGPLGVT